MSASGPGILWAKSRATGSPPARNGPSRGFTGAAAPTRSNSGSAPAPRTGRTTSPRSASAPPLTCATIPAWSACRACRGRIAIRRGGGKGLEKTMRRDARLREYGFGMLSRLAMPGVADRQRRGALRRPPRAQQRRLREGPSGPALDLHRSGGALSARNDQS